MAIHFSRGRPAQFNEYLFEIFHFDLSTRNVIQPPLLTGRNLQPASSQDDEETSSRDGSGREEVC